MWHIVSGRNFIPDESTSLQSLAELRRLGGKFSDEYFGDQLEHVDARREMAWEPARARLREAERRKCSQGQWKDERTGLCELW